MSNNKAVETEVNLGSEPIGGVRITMNEFNKDNFVLISDVKYFVYSIQQIIFKTGIFKV